MEKDAQETIKISVFTPIIYLGILLTCFITFSVVYRRRSLKKLSQVEPIFDENHCVNLYEALKARRDNPNVAKDDKPHDRVLKAALLRRGVEAIRRSMKLKESEPVYAKLYAEGLIGDDVFKQFQIQAKFQELELNEIVQECEGYKKGWAQAFFRVAQEICFNEALRRRLAALESRARDLTSIWQYYVESSEKPEPVAVETIKPIKAESTASGVDSGDATKVNHTN